MNEKVIIEVEVLRKYYNKFIELVNKNNKNENTILNELIMSYITNNITINTNNYFKLKNIEDEEYIKILKNDGSFLELSNGNRISIFDFNLLYEEFDCESVNNLDKFNALNSNFLNNFKNIFKNNLDNHETDIFEKLKEELKLKEEQKFQNDFKNFNSKIKNNIFIDNDIYNDIDTIIKELKLDFLTNYYPEADKYLKIKNMLMNKLSYLYLLNIKTDDKKIVINLKDNLISLTYIFLKLTEIDKNLNIFIVENLNDEILNLDITGLENTFNKYFKYFNIDIKVNNINNEYFITFNVKNSNKFNIFINTLLNIINNININNKIIILKHGICYDEIFKLAKNKKDNNIIKDINSFLNFSCKDLIEQGVEFKNMINKIFNIDATIDFNKLTAKSVITINNDDFKKISNIEVKILGELIKEFQNIF
jgi:hypothetical protein